MNFNINLTTYPECEIHRCKEDEVHKISTSIFVTNFPDQFNAKDLRNICKQYGNVVDTFIPNRRSKCGKRISVLKCEGENTPALVVLANEGFDNIEITYMSGYWVMIEFQSQAAKKIFEANVGISSWFSQIQQASGKVIWVRAKDVPIWVPDFVNENDNENDTNVETREYVLNGEDVGLRKFSSLEGDSDVEERQVDNTKGSSSDESMKYPLGFTPMSATKVQSNEANESKKESVKCFQSLAQEAKNDWVKELCVNNKVNFLSLQETKMENVEFFNIKMCWGNFAFDHVYSASVGNTGGNFAFGYVYSASVGNLGGILCVWDPRMFHKHNAMVFNYFVMIKGVWVPNGKNILIISVYAPQELAEKKMLWDYLTLVMTNWKGDVVIMGDFNKVRKTARRFGSVFNAQGADAFNLFILSAGLEEFDMEGFDNFVEETWKEAPVVEFNAMVKLMKKLKYLKEKIYMWNKGGYSSFITLIPKTPNANTVKDFRPINLIWSLYKIIAKILANRVVVVLGDIVNEARVIKEIHGEDGKIGKNAKSVYPSICLDIVHELELIKKQGIDLTGCIHKKMGNGANTSFWEDLWRGDVAFKYMYPRLYALEQYLRDMWVWSLEGSGEFTVASVKSPHFVSAAKLPILNPNEFDLWKMRIEHYFLMTDYSLWEVILNGYSPAPTRFIEGVVQPVAPTTAKQMLARKNELKAREKRFGGNEETKKNIAFVSSQTTDNTNEPVSVVASVSAVSAKIPVFALPNVDTLSNAVICSFFASQSNSSQLDNDDLKQIDADDLEEIDLNWKMAMLTVRARRFLQRTGRNLGANKPTFMGFDISKVECYNCHKKGTLQESVGLESVEATLLVYPLNETVFEEDIKLLKLEVQLRDNALLVHRQNFKKAEQERDDLKLKLEKFQTSSKNLSQLFASQTNDKTGLGYNNQVFTRSMFDCDEMFSSETDESLPDSPKYDRYQSGEGYHVVLPPYTGTFMPPRPELVFHNAPNVNETIHSAFNIELSPTKPDKDLSHTYMPSAPIIEDWVSDSEDNSEAEIPQKTFQSLKAMETTRIERHALSARVCLSYLIKDCDYYEKKMAQTPARNHAHRENHQQYSRMTLPNPQRHVVPTAVLTKSKLVPLTAARLVTTAVLQTHVTRPRQAKPVFTKPHSPPRRHITRKLGMEAKMPNLRPCFSQYKCINDPQKGNPQHALKDKRVIDSRCSRHMTGNMSYLSDFEAINGRYVAFGGNPNGRKISGKDTECLVLSPDFKLPDENQVLLRVPRENNMYNVDLKNIVPSEYLTCLFAKATLDESNLWHRRLGHINFKTMNNLVNLRADEGFLVGYSVSSKAFRVFNSRTRIVQETLRIIFLENKSNVAGSGLTWLFDIDTLTKSMNYQPVTAGNQSNPSVGIQEQFNASNVAGSGLTWLFDIDTLTKSMNYQPVTAGNQSNPSVGVQEQFNAKKAGEDNVQQYVLFPLWSSGSKNPQNIDDDAAFEVKKPEFEGKKPKSDVHVSPISSAQTKKHDDKTKKEAKGKSPIDTNTFSAAGPSNTTVSPTHGKSSYMDSSQYPDDPNMPALEDITYSNDEEHVGAEADFTNLETNIIVSPIPTTRVYKDHLVTQIIGDLSLATQTRKLKFNLFSVSQMCGKKNSVLFIDTECLVLSPDFKLSDESQVLLRVPRENNMYNVNLKNIVPFRDLTCLFAKATIDESNLWHKRLGHISFKTINKLVKGNLVRGLPIKVFENDNSCVACRKGKQHKAS
nr:RNA-directed DNA polymerase, eukaryota [Tanacetum cinerariifolium]